MDEQDLIEGLKRRDSVTLKYVYKTYRPVIGDYIKKNNGTVEDTHDVFQDAVVILVRKIQSPEMVFTSSIKTYLYSIAKHIWLARLKKKRKDNGLDEQKIIEELMDDVDINQKERIESIQKSIRSLGEDCQKIIHYFYYKKFPYEEIEHRMNYKKGYGRVKKHRCLNEIKAKLTKTEEEK